MTTALCFNCGETKFGAWCPCDKCGVASSGDPQLDILFSDHRMTVASLQEFGSLIKQLAARCDEPEVRFWAFISYLSAHPSQLLSATPPSAIRERVDQLLADADLPVVAAETMPIAEETGPPQQTIAIPAPLLQAFLQVKKFRGFESVQVRRSDGAIVNGILMGLGDVPQFVVRADVELSPEEIVAIRSTPGCLFGWLLKPRWTECP